jgi:hypothetical protein
MTQASGADGTDPPIRLFAYSPSRSTQAAQLIHRFMAAGVGLDLCAVHRNRAQLGQAHLSSQTHNLDKQLGKFRQMQSAKVADSAVGGKVTCRQHPKGDVLRDLFGDLAVTEGACGVGLDHDFDHHGRMKRLVAGAIFGVPGVKA